ncbi:tyrosine-type recombinase/integrase [Alicyclobacillus sp. SO9]|uniref:tyrosine-type recombinase/integrase n=1 Tax=Alicyclobacillus sp. SO9 TaxID=2665646 RepID=UPI0018E7A51E|nr:tyrosine-type recombinase/integrase [Alicyclobacillus sp. SO9]QQE77301.1 tyrosine-type recombinase/integrase [Alicyclobacillus sp. SO9]
MRSEAQTDIDTQLDSFFSSNPKRYRNLRGPISLHEGIDIAMQAWSRHPKTTRDTYERQLRDFSAFAHKKFQHPVSVVRLDYHCLAQYRLFLNRRVTKDGQLYSPASIQLAMDSLSSFFNVMVNLSYIPENPVRLLEDSSDRESRIRIDPVTESPLTLSLLKELLNLDFEKHGGNWGLRDKAIIRVAATFGTRESELREIYWNHLNDDILQINRKKRNLTGVYQLDEGFDSLLREVRYTYGLRPDDPMFISQYRCQLSKSGLRRIIKKYGEIIGLPELTMRHFRTRLLSELTKTYDDKTVQNFIGHKFPDTVNRWYSKRPKQQTQQVLSTVQQILSLGNPNGYPHLVA